MRIKHDEKQYVLSSTRFNAWSYMYRCSLFLIITAHRNSIHSIVVLITACRITIGNSARVVCKCLLTICLIVNVCCAWLCLKSLSNEMFFRWTYKNSNTIAISVSSVNSRKMMCTIGVAPVVPEHRPSCICALSFGVSIVNRNSSIPVVKHTVHTRIIGIVELLWGLWYYLWFYLLTTYTIFLTSPCVSRYVEYARSMPSANMELYTDVQAMYDGSRMSAHTDFDLYILIKSLMYLYTLWYIP
jgi:hypothetical protein